MTNRKIIVFGAAVAGAALLAGCSSSKSSANTAGPAGAAGTVGAAPSAPAVPGKQLTGTQLTAALLSAGDVPVSGFSATSGAAVDSGGSLTTAKAKFKLSSLSCADLENDMGETGFGESAMSSNALLDSAGTEGVSQAVYQFADATAANVFFTTLQAHWNSCGTFNVSDQSNSGKLTITAATAPSGLGQQDFANTTSGTENNKAMAMKTVVALDGPDVLLIGTDKLGGSTPPADLDAGTLLAKLITKVAAAG